MRIGIALHTCKEGMYVPSSFAGPEEIVSSAKMAEDFGFYSIWGPDFTTVTPSMDIVQAQPPNFYELLIMLSYIASFTKQIRLCTGAIVLPHRDPVLLAKQIATLDHFSNGRLIVGTGLGHYRDEFESIKPRERNSNRGRMLIESLEALHLLLTQDNVTFEGQYYKFNNISLNPKPVQLNFPIYISGKGPDVPMRVAKWGSGWMLSRMQDKSVKERVKDLDVAMNIVGRDVSEIDITTTRGISIATTTKKAFAQYDKSLLPKRTSGSTLERVMQQNLIGTPTEINEQLQMLQEEGITHLIAQDFAVNSFLEFTDQLQLFGEEVMPGWLPKDRVVK
jgi:probable F420-dependent oxidoreductase